MLGDQVVADLDLGALEAGDRQRRLIPVAVDHDVVLHSVQMVYEIRGGDDRQFELGDARIFAARAEHRLRLHDTNWKIVLKRMVLLNRHIPISNLTFII